MTYCRKPMTSVLLGGALALALLQPAAAQKLTERTKQKRAAEVAQTEAQQKLAALKKDIEKTEAAKGHAADALAASEASISEANRNIRELAGEQKSTEARLAALAAQKADLEQTVARQQDQLAKLLREQQAAGNEDRIKLLLSGDNPNRIYRDLQMLGYVSQAQARLLESLRANLAAVEKNQAETQEAKDELDEIAAEARTQKSRLQSEKDKRAALLGQLSGKLAAQRKEAGNIERNEQRLAALVERLDKMIEEQRRAEAAERERQKKLAEEKKKRDAEARAAAQARGEKGDKAPKADKPGPRIKDEPEAETRALAKNELTPESGPQDGAFAALRGKLRLPVKGDLTMKFGMKRGDAPASKGIFIRAAEGTEVKAVAQGRVMFADWLRGYGNLLVIDHGGGYLTLYGNNQAVLKRAGDTVKPGDTVAHAGNTGGNEQSGLYFQLTHQGKPIDPLDWVTLK